MQFSIATILTLALAATAMATPTPGKHQFSINIAIDTDDGDQPMPKGPCLKVCFPPDPDTKYCPPDSNWKQYIFGDCGTCCYEPPNSASNMFSGLDAYKV